MRCVSPRLLRRYRSRRRALRRRQRRWSASARPRFHMASLVAGKFSVVTTLSRSVPAIEHNLVRYGLASRVRQGAGKRCARCSNSKCPARMPAQDLRGDRARASRDDRAEAIVLGCAGMADLAAALAASTAFLCSTASPAPSSSPKASSRLGLRTSKVGGYAAPRSKSFSGLFRALLAGGERAVSADRGDVRRPMARARHMAVLPDVADAFRILDIGLGVEGQRPSIASALRAHAILDRSRGRAGAEPGGQGRVTVPCTITAPPEDGEGAGERAACSRRARCSRSRRRPSRRMPRRATRDACFSTTPAAPATP